VTRPRLCGNEGLVDHGFRQEIPPDGPQEGFQLSGKEQESAAGHRPGSRWPSLHDLKSKINVRRQGQTALRRRSRTLQSDPAVRSPQVPERLKARPYQARAAVGSRVHGVRVVQSWVPSNRTASSRGRTPPESDTCSAAKSPAAVTFLGLTLVGKGRGTTGSCNGNREGRGPGRGAGTSHVSRCVSQEGILGIPAPLQAELLRSAAVSVTRSDSRLLEQIF